MEKEKEKEIILLDVSSVHGVTGVVGSISIGFFGQNSFNKDGRDGIFFGSHSAYLLGVQILAVVVTGLWSALITFILLKLIEKFVGLKIDYDEELGLDENEHGEQAYGWRHSIIDNELTESQVHRIVSGTVSHHIQQEQRRLSLIPISINGQRQSTRSNLAKLEETM